MTNLPVQPEAVRQWIHQSNQLEVQAYNTLLHGGSAQDTLAILDQAFIMPADIAAAYAAWATEYNAAVMKLRAERQAKINKREITKIRAAACPRCFATHPGDC